MRYWRLPVLIVLLPAVGLGQESWEEKKHSVELFFPVSHFFDGSETNWLLWKEYRSHERLDVNGNVVSYDREVRLPFTFGLQYIRTITPRSRIIASIQEYGHAYNYDRSSPPGQLIRRIYNLLSVGYMYEILQQNKLQVSISGNGMYRHGVETILLFYHDFEIFPESFTLKDWGVSGGIRLDYHLPWSFVASGELNYCRFLRLNAEGVNYTYLQQGPSANTLTIKWGVGYEF